MNAVAAAIEPSAAARLAAAFRGIHAERMQGLPFVNGVLQVEAVGFRRWEGRWLGVLITPWFINLVLLPDELDAWRSIPVRGESSYSFPAGVFDFIGGFEPVVGEFQSCSLFSPVFEFASHEGARATAEAVLAALFDPQTRVASAAPLVSPHAADEAPIDAGRDIALAAAAPPSGEVSKRDFLRGRWRREPT